MGTPECFLDSKEQYIWTYCTRDHTRAHSDAAHWITTPQEKIIRRQSVCHTHRLCSAAQTVFLLARTLFFMT